MLARFISLLVGTLCLSACVTQQSYDRANYLVDSLSYELDREKRQRIKMQQYAQHLFDHYVDKDLRRKEREHAPPVFEEEPAAAESSNSAVPVKEPEAVVEKTRSISPKNSAPVNNPPEKDLNEMIAFPNMRVQQIPNGILVDIPDIEFFKAGSSQLTKEAKKYLAEFANRMAGRENYLIDIEGHTDDSEKSLESGIADRWDLSTIRATRVLRELVRLGVSPYHIIASGRGEFDPRTSNARKADRRKNRRIEIRITNKSR